MSKNKSCLSHNSHTAFINFSLMFFQCSRIKLAEQFVAKSRFGEILKWSPHLEGREGGPQEDELIWTQNTMLTHTLDTLCMERSSFLNEWTYPVNAVFIANKNTCASLKKKMLSNKLTGYLLTFFVVEHFKTMMSCAGQAVMIARLKMSNELDRMRQRGGVSCL